MNLTQKLKFYGLSTIALADCKRADVSKDISEGLYYQVNSRQCMHPDAADEEIASADINYIAKSLDITEDTAKTLQTMHQRLANRHYYNNKFPKNCHIESPEIHATKVFWDWESFERLAPHLLRPVKENDLDGFIRAKVWGSEEEILDRHLGKKFAETAQWFADEAFRKLGQQHIQIQDGKNGKEHQIHVAAEVIPGAVAGYAYLNDGTCSDHVNMRLDTINWTLVGLTSVATHEYGHNHGEPHQFTDQEKHHGVMSYNRPRDAFYGFSNGLSPHVLPKDPTYQSLAGKYGGKPVPRFGEKQPPIEPKPPVGEKIITNHKFILNDEEYTLEVKKVVKNIDDDGDGFIGW